MNRSLMKNTLNGQQHNGVKTDKLLVELNDRGGWGLRFDGEPISARIGNYPTAEDAARSGRYNCPHVEVVLPA